MAIDYKPDTVVAQPRKSRVGGMKYGAAFFGWLTATATAIILAIGTTVVRAAMGLSTPSLVDVVRRLAQQPQSIGLARAGIVAGIIGLAYYTGGYVAGRMARFDTARQGVAVWIWGLIVTAAIAARFIINDAFDVRPTAAGIGAAIGTALIALVGAIFGAAAGGRFHRRLDRAG